MQLFNLDRKNTSDRRNDKMMAAFRLLFAVQIFLLIHAATSLRCYYKARITCTPPGSFCDAAFASATNRGTIVTTCPSSMSTCVTVSYSLALDGQVSTHVESGCGTDQSSLPSGCYGLDSIDQIDPMFAQMLNDLRSEGVETRSFRHCKCQHDFCSTENGTFNDGSTHDLPEPGSLQCYEESSHKCSPPGDECDLIQQNLYSIPRVSVTCPAEFDICATVTVLLTRGNISFTSEQAGCFQDGSSIGPGCYGLDDLGQIDPGSYQTVKSFERQGIVVEEYTICQCDMDLCNTGGCNTTTPGNGGCHTTMPGNGGRHTTIPGNAGRHTAIPGNGGRHTTMPGNGGRHTPLPGGGCRAPAIALPVIALSILLTTIVGAIF